MYNHQNVVFHLFSPSAATLENIFKILLSNIIALDDIEKFLHQNIRERMFDET